MPITHRPAHVAIWAACGVLAAGVLVTGCSATPAPTLTAASTCHDYLNASTSDQDRAVDRIAEAQRNGAALTILGRSELNFECGNNPALNLGNAIHRAGGQPTSGATARPTASASAASCPGACYTDPGTVATVLDAARKAFTTVNSYDYRHLDADFAAGQKVTTGTYRSRYRTSMRNVVEPAARSRHVVQTAEISDEGVGAETSDGSVTVMIFGQTSVSSAGQTTPRIARFTATLTMQQVNGTWLLDALTEGGTAAAPGGSDELTAAVHAARTEVTRILTCSRAHFSRDFAAELNGATGTLRGDLAGTREQTHAALVNGHFDLSGTVTGTAVAKVTAATVTVLVAATSSRTGDPGSADDVSTPQSLVVTMSHSGSRWLASDMRSSAVS